MPKVRRVESVAQWVATVASGLIVLACLICILCGNVSVATGLCSELGIHRGAIFFSSWYGADWPPADCFKIGEPERTISDWAGEWAADGLWPSSGRYGSERWFTIPLWVPFAITFPAAICLWRDNRKWVVVAILSFIACCAGTRVLTTYFYDEYWPGHPDSFRAEIALLPQLSFNAFGDYFWRDRQQALIFVSACSVYALPPLVGLALARGRKLTALVIVSIVLSAGLASWDAWQRWDSYERLFKVPTRELFMIDAAWVIGLSVAGLATGHALRPVIARLRSSFGFCRACGYDLRVQRELGISRCPECGSLY